MFLNIGGIPWKSALPLLILGNARVSRDSDADAEGALPAVLSGPQVEATGSDGGNLLSRFSRALRQGSNLV